ncbi:MAG: hypothetical protein K9K40_10265 [Desulfotignum sp.]|nr:hypothetical protein [Desulfotignum sp.]
MISRLCSIPSPPPPGELAVQSKDRAFYLMQIQPSQTLENVVKGTGIHLCEHQQPQAAAGPDT